MSQDNENVLIMNQVLIVSATEFEINPFKEYCLHNNIGVNFLISGVGIHSLTFHLMHYLMKNPLPKCIIQGGIGGTFHKNVELGTVFQIESEIFADLGMYKEKGFISVFENGLIDPDSFPFTKGIIKPRLLDFNYLQKARGLTVNTCSNNDMALDRFKRNQSDVESMEGAAFFYVCSHISAPFAQIRAISNRVGEIDRSLWNMPLAINNLNKVLQQIIHTI